MAWTAPRTWVLGDPVTTTLLNQQVRDDFLYLYNAIGCRADTLSGATSYASGSQADALYADEFFDTDNMHNNAANTGRLTVKTAGKYWVVALGSFGVGGTGQRRVHLFWNNAGTDTQIGIAQEPSATATDQWGAAITGMADAAVGDYFHVQVFQAQGVAVNNLLSSGAGWQLSALRVGA